MAKGSYDVRTIVKDIAAYKKSKVKPLRVQLAGLRRVRSATEKQIRQLEDVLGQLTGKSSSNGDAPAPSKRRGSKQVKRSRDTLEELAKGIADFVKSKDGVSGGEIKKRYPGVGGTIKDFVKKYAGVTLKTKGDRRAMTYSV